MSDGIPVTRFDPDVHTAYTPRFRVNWYMIYIILVDVVYPSLLSLCLLYTTQWPRPPEALYCPSVISGFQAEVPEAVGKGSKIQD